MLRNWYLSCLQIAKEDGVVVETTDYFTEFFKNHGENAPLGSAPDPTSLPYFEGDYIPGEIESVISNATKEEEINNNRQRHIPKDNNPRRPTSGKRSGTRSNPGQLVNQTQDKIMNRLGIAIFNMKENLIIARLRSKRFCAAVERGDDVSKWPDYEEFRSELEGNCSRASCKAQKDSVDGEDSDAEKSEKKDGSPKKNRMNVDEMRSDVPTFGAESKQIVGSKDLPMIGSTAEVDQEFESELFESRQSFLNYCQSNHCQFDEMRRAKHSSMMVLYQLHNPSAPKYVQICAACGCDISAGYRYHCIVCTNYDLCQDCYQPVKSGSWRSRGTKFAHDTSHTFSRINVEASTQADKGREVDQERNKTLQAYLDVLVHAAKCNGPAAGCRSNNCAKMKRLVVHVQTCHVTHSGGCKICARLLSLIIVHARTCMTRGDGCPLPFCDKIRERNERVRRQQLFMDDRRRQAQNAYYQSGE
jgi:E1A/CREB-binding protein